jgi:hypothetical protein
MSCASSGAASSKPNPSKMHHRRSMLLYPCRPVGGHSVSGTHRTDEAACNLRRPRHACAHRALWIQRSTGRNGVEARPLGPRHACEGRYRTSSLRAVVASACDRSRASQERAAACNCGSALARDAFLPLVGVQSKARAVDRLRRPSHFLFAWPSTVRGKRTRRSVNG